MKKDAAICCHSRVKRRGGSCPEWRFYCTSKNKWWNLEINMVTVTAVLSTMNPSDGFINKDEIGIFRK